MEHTNHTNPPQARLLPVPSKAFRLAGIKRSLDQHNQRVTEILKAGCSFAGWRELTMITDQIQRLNLEIKQIGTANDG
jgi:hypothetical protein